jgi:hypothetical protein
MSKYIHEKKIEVETDSDEDYLELLVQTMTKWFSFPREGHHVSNVVLCPRQRVFKEIYPTPLNKKDLNMYSSGRAIHEAIQSLFMGNRGRFEKEKYVEYSDIIGSVDIYDQKKNVPIEFKTTRSNNIIKPKSFHVEQLKYYMAMLNTKTGYVLYQCLMNFGDDPFKQFQVKMTEKEISDQLNKLKAEMNSLELAQLNRDPSLARHVYFDSELNWLCKECPYSLKCSEMRVRSLRK